MAEFFGIPLEGLFGVGNAEVDKVIPIADLEKLEAITSTVDRLLLLVGVNSGISIEELLSIRKQDVDFDAQTIYVYDNQKKRDRVITIPKELMNDLRSYMKTSNTEMNYIFNFSRPTLDKHIGEWTERTLGYRRSWKSLRRTFIAKCAAKGWGVYIAANNSGVPPNDLISYFALSPQQKRDILNNNGNNSHGTKR